MKRLIFVCEPASFFVSHRLPLAVAARDAGYEVWLASNFCPAVAVAEAAGLRWTPIPFDRGGMNAASDLRTLVALIRLFRRLRPTVVHLVTVKPVLYGTLAARVAKVPRVVAAVSGLGYLFTRERRWRRLLGTVLYRMLLRHPHLSVVLQNGDDMAEFRHRRMAPPGTPVLIPGSGVDLALFDPDPVRDDPPVVLMTARMLADKGVREFIAAARLLAPAYPHVRFLLAGAPDRANPSSIPEAELRAAAPAEWLGFRTDIPALLARASIYVLPSYREGLPKSLLEAGAAGLPLVTTDTTGCREVVRDAVTGLLVPVADAPALGRAIGRLLADPSLCARLGAAARADVAARFALPGVVAAHLALYAA